MVLHTLQAPQFLFCENENNFYFHDIFIIRDGLTILSLTVSLFCSAKADTIGKSTGL